MRRLLPYPVMAAALLVMWLLLNGLSAGNVLLGSVIAIGACWAMTALQPHKPRIRRWDLIPLLALTVLRDATRSNLAVATILLTGARRERTSGFVTIPLRLRDPMGLAFLACIITSTPGTAWVEYRSATGQLLIHVLDLVDEKEWIHLIQNRYESLLLEIFE